MSNAVPPNAFIEFIQNNGGIGKCIQASVKAKLRDVPKVKAQQVDATEAKPNPACAKDENIGSKRASVYANIDKKRLAMLGFADTKHQHQFFEKEAKVNRTGQAFEGSIRVRFEKGSLPMVIDLRKN